MRAWHDPQKSLPLLLQARRHVLDGLALSEAGKKREAARELKKAEALRHRSRQPLGMLRSD